MNRRIFVTGGTGFVGRQFLHAAGVRGVGEIVCLVRDPGRTVDLPATAPITFVTGDLSAPESYADSLRSIDAVVHLGASTGKASGEEHRRTNLEGTRGLLEACRRRGIPRFVHVSTIAVKFRETRDYPYARSKLEAERAVRESGLMHAIVRPTVIVGRGGGAWERLRALARLPVIPLPGPGTARVQPIAVADVIAGLTAILEGERFWGGTFDLGGPEPMAVETFLRRIHRRDRGRDACVLHLPARGPLALLGVLEQWSPVTLPIGPWQLRSFYEDGTADPNPLFDHVRPGMTPVDAMIDAADGSA